MAYAKLNYMTTDNPPMIQYSLQIFLDSDRCDEADIGSTLMRFSPIHNKYH